MQEHIACFSPATGPWALAFLLVVGLHVGGCATLAVDPSCSSATPSDTCSILETELPEPVQSTMPQLDVDDLVVRVQEEVNAVRAAHNLPALRWTEPMAMAAQRHSTDMAEAAYFSHTNRSGQGPTGRAEALGIESLLIQGNYVYSGVGENLFLSHRFDEYRRFVTEDGARYEVDWLSEADLARRAVRSWMSSPSHRRNLLCDTYRSTGLGVSVGQNGTVYITHLFALTDSLLAGLSE